MRNLSLVTLLTLLLISIHCTSPNSADDPALVSNLRFAPSAFDSFKANTEMRFTLKTASPLSIYIMKKDSSQQEQLVKTLIENVNETKGSHSITWLGETNQRFFAPIGMYYGVVRIKDHSFETTVQVFHF